MRRKRVELQEAVIVAARGYVNTREGTLAGGAGHRLFAYSALVEAVQALDRHEAAELTGQGAKWVHGSPETSREAAIRATPIQGSMRHQVIVLLAHDRLLTDEMLEFATQGKHQTVSSARNWLVEAGWVQDSGFRKQTRSKREAVVWELTPAGYRQIGDL